MGIQSTSALIAAILLLALGINVAFSERRVVHRAPFVALVTAFFAYNLAFFFNAVVGGGFWLRMVVVSGVAVAQLSLRFFERYLDVSMGAARAFVNLASAAILVLTLTRLGEAPEVGAVSALLAVGVYGYCVWRLYERYRAVQSKVEATRLLYLVIGGVLSATFSALDLLPYVGLPFPAAGHLLTVVYFYIWTQVIQRSRLLDLQEMLGRGLSLALLAVVIASIYSLIVVWLRDRLGLFFFTTVVASVVLIFVLEPLKKVVELWIGRLVFRETFELGAQLAFLRVELPSVINLGDLVARVLERLQLSRRVTHASVFLLESGGHAYFKADAVGPVEADRVGVVAGRAFLDALREEKVLALETVERELLELDDAPAGRERLTDVRDSMERMSAGLSVAFLSDDRLLGFLNVKDERLREAFSSAEIDQIAALTVQITAVIENTELFEKLKERDRLSYIGEMATGMAHEIRNPLAAIKAAAELLDPARLDEAQREWVDVMMQETSRLNLVLSQFLDYARPYRGELAPVDVTIILERVATLVRAVEHEPPIEVSVEVERGLPRVMADADRIQQVCLNLARNACDAMADGGRLTLSAHAWAGGADRVEIRVRDDGPGIPDEVRKNLFIPFYTTKRHGTGLGLAISERILEHHGATMRVDSGAGHGTTMRFSLAGAADDDSLLTGEHRRQLATETSAGAAPDREPQ